MGSKKSVTDYDNPYAERPKTSGKKPSSLGYAVGDTVEHARFGKGKVTEITEGSKDLEVTVEFSCGPKRMLASFAKLRKI